MALPSPTPDILKPVNDGHTFKHTSGRVLRKIWPSSAIPSGLHQQQKYKESFLDQIVASIEPGHNVKASVPRSVGGSGRGGARPRKAAITSKTCRSARLESVAKEDSAIPPDSRASSLHNHTGTDDVHALLEEHHAPTTPVVIPRRLRPRIFTYEITPDLREVLQTSEIGKVASMDAHPRINAHGNTSLDLNYHNPNEEADSFSHLEGVLPQDLNNVLSAAAAHQQQHAQRVPQVSTTASNLCQCQVIRSINPDFGPHIDFPLHAFERAKILFTPALRHPERLLVTVTCTTHARGLHHRITGQHQLVRKILHEKCRDWQRGEHSKDFDFPLVIGEWMTTHAAASQSLANVLMALEILEDATAPAYAHQVMDFVDLCSVCFLQRPEGWVR